MSRGDLYAAFVDREIERETQIRLSMDQRCLAVVSASGVFVTVLLALLAMTIGPEGADNKSTSFIVEATVAGALMAYISAAWSGFSAIRPRPASRVDASRLKDSVWKSWQDWHLPQPDLSWEQTWQRVDILVDYQRFNTRKGSLISRAIAGEVIGIILTGACVLEILLGV